MSEEKDIPNDPEIEKILAEFEAKNTEQAPKKLGGLQASKTPIQEESNIRFETDNWRQSVSYPEESTPKMVQLVMKWFGIKQQKTAEYVLLGLVLVMLLVSFYLFFSARSTPESNFTPEADILLELE